MFEISEVSYEKILRKFKFKRVSCFFNGGSWKNNNLMNYKILSFERICGVSNI